MKHFCLTIRWNTKCFPGKQGMKYNVIYHSVVTWTPVTKAWPESQRWVTEQLNASRTFDCPINWPNNNNRHLRAGVPSSNQFCLSARVSLSVKEGIGETQDPRSGVRQKKVHPLPTGLLSILSGLKCSLWEFLGLPEASCVCILCKIAPSPWQEGPSAEELPLPDCSLASSVACRTFF